MPNNSVALEDIAPDFFKQQAQGSAALIRNNVTQAIGVNPDTDANYQHLARFVGVPSDTVRAMPDTIKQQAAVKSMDVGKIVSDYPHLAQFMGTQDNVNMVHDDIPGTAAVERAVKSLGMPANWDGTSMTAGPAPSYMDRLTGWLRDMVGMPAAGRDEGAAARAFLDLQAKRMGTTRDELRQAVGGMSEIPTQFANSFENQFTAGLAPDATGPANTTGGQIASGVGGLAGFIAGAPLKLAGAAVERVPQLATTVGDSFVKALGKDMTRQAATLGIASGVTAAGQALDQNNVADAAGVVGKAAKSGSEMGAVFGAAGRLFPDSTALQLAARALSVNATMDAIDGNRPWDDRSIAQKVYDYGLNTVFSLNGAGRTGGGWLHDAARADTAVADAQVLGGLAQAAANSKLRERAPEVFKQFVQSAGADAPIQSVYIDAKQLVETLHQGGVGMDELTSKLPDIAQQLPEALMTGGQVEISVPDFATHIAGGKLEQPLMPHLRTDPAGMTLAESQAFYQNHLEQLQAAGADAATQHAADEPFQQSRQQVFDGIKAQLDATGRYRPDVVDAYAALHRDFYTTMADRTGVLPHELMEKYPVRIAAESPVGGPDKTLQQDTIESPGAPNESGKPSASNGQQAQAGDLSGSGRVRGSSGVLDEPSGPNLGNDRPLEGLPTTVRVNGQPVTFGPFAPAREAARTYAEKAGIPYDPPKTYVKVDPARATRIADAFTAMKHDPQSPEVKASYDAMIKETLAQWDAIKATGLKVEFISGDDPYGNPRNAMKDVTDNNHLWVFPTSDGFGGSESAHVDVTGNPLMQVVPGEEISGRPVQANDIFRIVHDYFGHVKEGVGFRAEGEENAWRAHMSMYSELARKAATTETRGQNSWVNFGPYAESNKTAEPSDTQYAPQKIGLLPDWVVNEGRTDNVLNQTEGGKPPRGAFDPVTKTIALLKGADLSTFLHESGHFFLDALANMAAHPDAPEGIKADMSTLLKSFNVSDLDTWHAMSLDEQRQHHEAFARGFEAYLLEGKAPTLEQRGLFGRFRSWLGRIYKSLSDLGDKVSPEVKGVMDRLIASEDAINQAEQARGYMPLFDTPEKASMSPEDWAKYQALGKDATDTAIEALASKTVRDMAWLDRTRSRALKALQKDAAEKRRGINTEVRGEVMSQPVYRAWSFLTGRDTTALPEAPSEAETLHASDLKEWKETRESQVETTRTSARAAAWEASDQSKKDYATPQARGLAKGQFIAKNRKRIELDAQRAMLDWEASHPKPVPPEKDNTATNMDPTTGAGKLNTDALRTLAGDDVAKKLQDLRMNSKTGIDPGLVADMFGFKDGQQLATALALAEHPKDVVSAMVDQRMLERHGEIADPKALALAADDMVHNEVRTRFIATELRALNKAIGPARDLAAAAKEVAEATIDGRRVRSITEGPFTVAETKAAMAAERRLKDGDTAGAAVAKRDQLLNNQLARAARDALDYIDKSVKYLNKFNSAGVRANIDLEYRDQIDALLDRYDIRKSVSGAALDKREALLSFVERMASQGYEPQIPERLLDEAQRQHYKDMPLGEFKGLVDAVKSIEHLGKLKSRLLDLKETREISDLADEVKVATAKLPQRPGETNRGLSRIGEKWLDVKAAGRSLQAALLKMEQMFDWLDARDSNGPLNRVVFRRLSEAGVKENDLLARVKGEIDNLIHANLADVTKDGGKIYTASGLVDGLSGEPLRLTKKQMLMLAGNMGNESNAAKLSAGEKWNQAEVWNFLNAHMSKADWDFVAGMGKTLEGLWPEKLAMSRRLGNTNPDKIQPRAFDTPHGRYEGWYWPLIYDPARAQDVAERGAKQGDALFENTYSRANTDTGRMNTRSENYARPILLDLDVLPKIIKDEIHDIAFREAVIDSDRFLSNGEVRGAIVKALSQQHYDQLRPWLQSIANDGRTSTEGMRALKFFNDLAHGVRTRATMVGLGFQLSTTIVHTMSAGVESVAELGPKWMLEGLKDFANPMQWAANKDFIFERSGEMRNRMNEGDRDVREHLRTLATHMMDPTTGKIARGLDNFKAHAYTMIAAMDMMSALPTWMGAYKRGMAPPEQGGLGMSEQDAIYLADKTVRNAHGGTGVKDMAAVQRGPEMMKLFTMFYTFWNHNVNRIMDTAKLIVSPEHRAAMKEANNWSDSQLAATVIMRTLVYTIGVQALHSLVHPPAPGADQEHWFAWAGKEFMSSAFAGIPVLRDLAAHYINGKDYSATPAAGLVKIIDNSRIDAMNALTGEHVSDKWIRHTITTAGAAFNLPLGGPSAPIQFLWDVIDGNQHPDSAADWWNGILHGDMKTH